MTMAADASSWRQTPGLTDFLNRPLPENWDFFREPPPEVGMLKAASSNVRTGEKLWPLATKFGAAAGAAIATFFIVSFAGHFVKHKEPIVPYALGGLAAVIVGAVGCFFATRQRHLCFVGAEGAALYSTRGDRADATGQVVRYAEVASIALDRSLHRKRGEVQQMVFDLTLSDPAGKPLLKHTARFHPRWKIQPNADYIVALAIHAGYREWCTANGKTPPPKETLEGQASS